MKDENEGRRGATLPFFILHFSFFIA